MPDSLSDDDLLDARLRLPQHVVQRSFVAETVVLNLRTGKYHGLNVTAGEILDGLEGDATPREVATEIAQQYGRDETAVQADVVALCRGLLERQLVEIVGQGDENP
ncbi:MAG TPA: PqqD family protein [Solirubrobacteraceae bacterium]|jgi:hypothetical protein